MNQKANIIANFRMFLRYFGKGYGPSMTLIMLGSVLLAIFETLTIFVIFPLLELVLDPAGAVRGGMLGFGYRLFGSPPIPTYVMIISGMVAGFYLAKAFFQVWFSRWEHRVLSRWKVSIGLEFFRKYLDADYNYHAQRNSSGIITLISSTISSTLNDFTYHVLSLCSQALTAIFICSFLVYRHPMITLIIAVFFAILFYTQNSMIKKRIQAAGEEVTALSSRNMFALQQGLGAYKETKINLKEEYFAAIFKTTNNNLVGAEGRVLFLKNLPGATTELIVLLTTILTFNLIVHSGQTAQAITKDLAVIVLTLFRLIPLVNRGLTSFSYINSALYGLHLLITEADTIGYGKRDTSGAGEGQQSPPQPLPLRSQLELTNLSFSYPKAGEKALDDINLTVTRGEFIGVIGPSGSGKTTLVAVLLGLVKGDQGAYRVDGQEMTDERIRSLRASIGYVDQQPFIFDGSVMENVAFGVDLDKIDTDRVELALRQAQLWETVQGLEKGMKSSVGENGKRFSGGQRQRLAIARALYKEPTLLILDEATSALDPDTEYRISQTVQGLKGSRTIIAIAHRLSTLQACDRLILMDRGKLVDSGPFDELYTRNATFRHLVELSGLKGDEVSNTPC
ncbi:ABC transporter ATP-binding protein [Novispirillum itersonii]|uniref:ABC transporter ATP-binding protein n=1 Tax=Novispirillum itersonii TaxID=189 RepID=UPI0003649032|nr:ABC transporter ATP-binding protein [Novispirillum itersonii]